MKTILTLALSLILCACGGGGGGGSPAPITSPGSSLWPSFSVSSASELPTCSGDIVGRLYYVEASSNFQACKSTGWTVINVTGPSGANGTNNRFVYGVYCSGIVSGLIGAAGTALNGLNVYYQADVTNSGDVIAYAAVATSSIQVGATSFYASTQNGATTASVLFTADFATANGGFWNISTNRSTLVVTAVYTDSSLGADSPVTMTFLPSSCALTNF